MAGKKKYCCNFNPDKQWGGRREGAGSPKWKSGNATPIRIPEHLHEAVLAYAHALDDGTPLPPSNGHAQVEEQQGIIHPNKQTDTLTAEDIRQMQLSVEAMSAVLERWRKELSKHNPKLPRWEKANQLFDELEAHLTTPWL